MPRHPDRATSRQRLARRQPLHDLRQLLDRMERGPLTEAQGRIVAQAKRSADTIEVAVSDLIDVCCVEDPPVEETEAEVPPDDDTWIDVEVTRRLRILDRPGRPGVLGRLVGVWADRSLSDLEALGDAVDGGSCARVERITAAWRGATQNLGGFVLAGLLRQLETQAHGGQLPTDAQLDRIAAGHAATLAALLRRVAEEASWTPEARCYSSPLRSVS
ncbi:MAG: hypothetical protein KC621_13400 [Myxococcales bacterium]|nr:hypothetical protein [Myxococcales bacterium]